MLRRSALWSDPRLKPPFGVAEIDWGHPLSSGCLRLVILEPMMVTMDLASQSVYQWSAAVETGPPVFGQPSPGMAGTATLPLAPIPTPQGRLSFFVRAMNRANSTNRFLCGSHDRDTDTNGVGCYWHYGGDGFIKYYFGAGGANVVNSGLSWDVGASHSVGGSLTDLDQRIFIDGVVKGTLAVATPECGSSKAWGVGRESWDGGISDMFLWSRFLSPGEHGWLAAEPYAMLRPIVRRRYFVPAAAGGGIPTLVGPRFSLAGSRGLAG